VRVHLVKGAVFLLILCLAAGDAQAFSWPWEKRSSEFGVRSSEKKKEPDASFPNSELPTPNSQVVKASLTLVQAYEKALQRSESVAITAKEIDLAQARFYRSFDYFLPQVHFEMTRFQQDVDDDVSSSGQLNFGRQRTPEKKFVFSQPLFSGFREIAALSGAGADKKEQRMKLKRAKEVLFVDVMEAYYTLLNSGEDVGVLYAIRRMMSERMKDLDDRVRLGRSRESESKTSFAEMKILESDLVEAKRAQRAAKNLLEFYTGENLESVSLAEENGEEREVLYVPGAEQGRSDVVQYEQAYIVAQKKVIAANANFFPEISLDGNYYTHRVGFQSGNDWDVTLKFDVPVFEVAQTLGDVKEAASLREQARLEWEERKRQANLEARDALEELRSDLEAERTLEEARRASKENYEILQKEFSTNLVNNLDVLDSLRSYQDTQRRYERARYDAKKSYWRLKLALGEIGVL